MLRVETIGKVNPLGKPGIYFAARKEDYGFLNSVISNLFMAANVAVYYDDAGETANTDDATLLRMNVIVLILTEDLLKGPTDVMTRVFPLAIHHKIPLMILGMSDNVGYLLDDFCEKNHLGNRHVIFPNKKDSGRTFLAKLKDFLNEHAFADETLKKIRKTFDGKIFLSYRKVDKPLASKVIAKLNRAKECLGYGLWYDEYLTAGENFDEEIQAYIDASDVFLLLLTPAMLQRGSYALEREHSRALQEGKTVVILDFIGEPHDLPEELLLGDPTILPPDAASALPKILEGILGHRPCTTRWERAEQSYLLGLAYQRGIAKDKEESIAISLIREAATAGHLDAMETMVKICVDHYDVAAAIDWQTALTNHYGNGFRSAPRLSSLDKYLHHLGILAEYHGMQQDYEGMKTCYQMIWDLLGETSGWEEEPSLLESAVIAADKLGTFAEIEINAAKDKAGQLRLAREYYKLSYSYAQKFAYFEHGIKAYRYLYTPLMRLADLDAKWTDAAPEELFARYEEILAWMLKADQEYPCYETLCDLGGCYQTLTQLSENACPHRTMELGLKWLERTRQAYLTSRHLERCGKYAQAMEYVAGLQYAAGNLAEGIRNLNKATKARWECISGKQKSGVDPAPDVTALFYDYVNDARMHLQTGAPDNAALCIQGAEDALRRYPDLLGSKRNLILLENLHNALQEMR